MWLMFEWQFAHTTDETSRKFTAPSAMLANGNMPVYGVAPPTSVAVVAISAGNFEHSKTSCSQRTRRKPKFENIFAFIPGCVSTPTVTPPFVQSPGVIAMFWYVGHVPDG